MESHLILDDQDTELGLLGSGLELVSLRPVAGHLGY